MENKRRLGSDEGALEGVGRPRGRGYYYLTTVNSVRVRGLLRTCRVKFNESTEDDISRGKISRFASRNFSRAEVESRLGSEGKRDCIQLRETIRRGIKSNFIIQFQSDDRDNNERPGRAICQKCDFCEWNVKDNGSEGQMRRGSLGRAFNLISRILVSCSCRSEVRI